MTLALAALRLLRGRLHARAFESTRAGRHDTARTLWVLVEELDHLINLLTTRRRPCG